MNIELHQLKKVYFIGIGGIGMSAIARFLNLNGVKVFGYDKVSTTLTQKLSEEGIHIHYEEDVEGLPKDIDLVVYTPAIPKDHKELVFFQNGPFPVMKRAEVLGLITRSKRTIAIAGTHGKTTTSTIVTHLLRSGGVDCSAFLGGIAKNFESNFVGGKSEWIVAEADEFDRSFLHLAPDIAAILSMEADHLDIYGDLESIQKTGFQAFAKKIKSDGKLFVQHNWAHLLPDQPLETFGIDQGDYCSKNIRVENGFFVFDYQDQDVEWNDLVFAMPGRHNIENATVAIAIAKRLGVIETDIRKALKSFKGIKRRFEVIYRNENVVHIDDYAHHPSELKAAIHAARQFFPGKKISGVFQPHLFSRTRDFVDGFAEALDGLDEAWLLDIYPARELPIPGVSSSMIFDQMKLSKKQCLSKEDLYQKIERSDLEILLTLGAGDIGAMTSNIQQILTGIYGPSSL